MSGRRKYMFRDLNALLSDLLEALQRFLDRLRPVQAPPRPRPGQGQAQARPDRAVAAALPAPSSSGGERAQRLVQSRRAAEHRGRVAQVFGRLTEQRTQALLQERVFAAVDGSGAPRRLAARWRVPPSAALAGAPVIEADRPEIALVCLLALTSPDWQFSSTPAGQMFPSAKRGYTKAADGRDYVTGISTILDTVSGVIEQHRGGAGGRVYVTPHHVECAECKRVIAWINQVGRQVPAWGRCSGR